MRQVIQGISLVIVVFLGLVLASLDQIEAMHPTARQLTIIITIIYMLAFLLVAIDPNMIRVFIFGPFGPYVSLLILIIIFLLTYLFLVPAIQYLVGGFSFGAL